VRRPAEEIRAWTADELERLEAMYRSGVAPVDIRRALNRNKNQIKNAIQRLRERGVEIPPRSAGRPTLKGRELDWQIAAEIGSARLRDAMMAYYTRHVWSVAA
jgi:biotin operon repressor